jgi:predicted transcriptional regulator
LLVPGSSEYVLFEYDMASTSVPLPRDLVERLDRLAKESGRSRNRVIVEALEAYLRGGREEWPEDFLSDERLNDRDRRYLGDALQ